MVQTAKEASHAWWEKGEKGKKVAGKAEIISVVNMLIIIIIVCGLGRLAGPVCKVP